MNPEEMRMIQEQDESMRAMQTREQMSQMNMAQQAMLMQEQEESMAKEQLDLSKELKRIRHLIRGEIETTDKKGNPIWILPEDRRLIVLSEYGVEVVINTLEFYLNKNTLLSNYDEETINHKLEDFAEALNDYLYMDYENVFEEPTFEDCKKVLNKRMDKKRELRKFALELLGKEASEEEVKKELIQEMEGTIEKEMQKIREGLRKDKLKRYELIIREIQDAVHSTYLRSWKGQERSTLRQHTHISETRGGMQMPVQQPGFNPFRWLKPR